MVPIFAVSPTVVIEQGMTAEAALDATNGTIDSSTRAAVIFLAAQCLSC